MQKDSRNYNDESKNPGNLEILRMMLHLKFRLPRLRRPRARAGLVVSMRCVRSRPVARHRRRQGQQELQLHKPAAQGMPLALPQLQRVMVTRVQLRQAERSRARRQIDCPVLS